MCNLSTGVYNKGVREGRAEGVLETLFGLVKDRLLPSDVAADRAGMEQTVFEKKYQEYLQGFFRVPCSTSKKQLKKKGRYGKILQIM